MRNGLTWYKAVRENDASVLYMGVVVVDQVLLANKCTKHRYQKELREKAKEREREIARMEREKRREEKKNNANSGANDETDDEEVRLPGT